MLKELNCFGTGVVLAIGLALTAASLHAEATINGAASNPYSFIVSRNVFGLNPPQPPAPEAIDKDLPKITANGIMSVFGHLEVLFTTSASKGGKQNYYDLSEGQRQDDIAVVSIDNENGQVTFDNHGVQQEIALANEKSTAGKLAFAREFGTPPIARHPKPGDYDWADQQTVTAPLSPQNQAMAEIQGMQSEPMSNGGDDAGNSSPPGHGGP